jgi:excisionase family DNA binding protein
MIVRPVDFDRRVFNISESAAWLRVSRSYLYLLIAEKRIWPIKLGTRTLITGQEIGRFLASASSAA